MFSAGFWWRCFAWVSVLLIVLFVSLLLLFWRATIHEAMVPRTPIPFTDLRRFQRIAESVQPGRLLSGESVRLELSNEDVQKMATWLALTQPNLAQTQFAVNFSDDVADIQLWWPTGQGDRFLPVQLLWQPDAPFELSSLSIAAFRLPDWALTLLNRQLASDPSMLGVKLFWHQFDPEITLTEQQLVVELQRRHPI